MERIKSYVKDFNGRHASFSLELPRHDADSSQTLIVRCNEGVRFHIDKDWGVFRAKVFCKTNQVLQVVPEPGSQNLENAQNGRLTLVFKKNVDDLDVAEVEKFILKLEKLLTDTLPEYTIRPK